MKSFIQICIAIGFLLIHIETVAMIHKISGGVVAFVLFSMPIVAELHLGVQSILHEGLINPVTVTYGLFIGFVTLSAGWLRE